MEEFKSFGKMARYSRDVIVTEKIDGTNAQICIGEDGSFQVGSRTRWITPENDNYGFAKWAYANKEELLKLGPGRHYGEWWGHGIQRGYGLPPGKRHFSLFNALRWNREKYPDIVQVVPILYFGSFDELDVEYVMKALQLSGSHVVPFRNPEGIVIYHTQGAVGFKKTFEHDEYGKEQACNLKQDVLKANGDPVLSIPD